MTEKNLTHDQEMHIESHAPYIKVWAALAVFTVIEYLFAMWLKDTFFALVATLMTCAVIKAALVGWYFMHLKFEGKWVYVMLIPAGILAMVLIFGLIPDIAMQPQDSDLTGGEDISVMAPAPAPSPRTLQSPRLSPFVPDDVARVTVSLLS
jgi:cytochrome c oxidase subunit IV